MTALERSLLTVLGEENGLRVAEMEDRLYSQGVEVYQYSILRCLWRLGRNGRVVQVAARWFLVPLA